MTKTDEMQKQLDRIETSVDKLVLLLHGNGKLGICAKINILWSTFTFIIIAVGGILVKMFMGGNQ